MITFILYAMSYITGYAIPGTVFWITGLIDGLLFPLLFSGIVVPKVLAARPIREMIARLNYLQAVAPLRGVVLVLTPWGYDLAPVEDGVAHLSSGLKLTLKPDEQTWYRLGNRRFGVTYIPSEEVLGELLVDPDEIDLEYIPTNQDEEGNVTEVSPVIKDGKGLLSTTRSNLHGYTPFPRGDVDGFIVSLSRAINSLRGGGSVRISEQTEQSTRMEKGGGANVSMNQRWLYMFLTLVMSAIIWVAIFGVFS